MTVRENIRIANCSGYYGDKLSAAKDLVEGGPVDFLTGDYLAELTMGILYSQRLKRGEEMGYVGTFLKQYKDIAQTCQSKGIKIVVNAGGLNPRSMAGELNKINQELSLVVEIQHFKDMMLKESEIYLDGDSVNQYQLSKQRGKQLS